jgi:hypothetical protein
VSTATDPAGVMDLDPRASGALHNALPGLRQALDPGVMGAGIESRLLSRGVVVDACRPGKCLYLGVEGCSVRYDLTVRRADGAVEQLLVLGRVHPDGGSVQAYRRSLEAPIAAMRARGGVPGVDSLAASLPEGIVVHPFPVDADLPTLVAATDPERMAPLLRGAGVPVERCTPVLGHYGRRHRCVLRYDVDGAAAAYGKVGADGRRAERAGQILRALHGRVEGVSLPPFLGYVPDLRLALLGALPGHPALAGELARPGGRPVPLVEAAATAAAALHHSGVELGAVRRMPDELDELAGLLELMDAISPELTAALRSRLEVINAAAASAEPMPHVLGHGDFTPSQLLRDGDGDGCGLVDFDGVAQAEPALDLGQYVAYLRLAAAKAGMTDADDLAHLFLEAYAAATGVDGAGLRARVQVYVCVSLFRTTVHAWQKLKPKRVRTVLPILLEEVGCLPAADR